MKLVPCMCWVASGVASAIPVKVRLPTEDMKQLIQGGMSDFEETSEADSDADAAKKPKGLRGSASKETVNKNGAAVEDVEDAYKLGDYDTDTGASNRSMISGIASFANPQDDPYIGEHGEGDSDVDDEDYQIKAEDCLLLVGRINKDESGLEVYLYNENENSFYVHHDYMLDAPPMCITSITYDPGASTSNSTNSGNLAAVGTMKSVVEIWDIDLVDSVEPCITLGADAERLKKKKGGQPVAKKKKGLTHTDAVLDLSWNKNLEHLLLSGSADSSIILWDLDAASGSTQLHGEEKIQSIQWHPLEPNIFVSGCSDGNVTIWDGRSSESKQTCKVEGEVEKVVWNPNNPFLIVVLTFHTYGLARLKLASTDSGALHCIDSRKSVPLFSLNDAHKETIHDITFSQKYPDCMVTCSEDHYIKVWQVKQSEFEIVASKKMKMDGLLCCSFCSDTNSTLAIGGQKGDFVKIIDLANIENVAARFFCETDEVNAET